MVVVFPAPFGPRKPRISPRSTRKLTSSTAVTRPKCLVRCWTSITGDSALQFGAHRPGVGIAAVGPRPTARHLTSAADRPRRCNLQKPHGVAYQTSILDDAGRAGQVAVRGLHQLRWRSADHDDSFWRGDRRRAAVRAGETGMTTRPSGATCAVCVEHVEEGLHVAGMDCGDEIALLEQTARPPSRVRIAVGRPGRPARPGQLRPVAARRATTSCSAVAETGMRAWPESRHRRAPGSRTRQRRPAGSWRRERCCWPGFAAEPAHLRPAMARAAVRRRCGVRRRASRRAGHGPRFAAAAST